MGRIGDKKERIRIVIRNMDDVINFQILRWKSKYPDAAEPEEWSDNEIKPNEHYDATEDLSEDDEKVILADDAKRGMTRQASKFTGSSRGTYDKGYGSAHANPEFQALAAASHKDHYDNALKGALEELQKEFGQEYDIVFEGQYAKELMGEGTEKANTSKKGIRARY